MRSCLDCGCFSRRGCCLDRGRIARRAVAQKTGRRQKNQHKDEIEFHARLLSSGCASVFSSKDRASWKIFQSVAVWADLNWIRSKIGTARFRFRERQARFNPA